MKYIKKYKIFEKQYEEFDLVEELLLNLKDDGIDIKVDFLNSMDSIDNLRILLSSDNFFSPEKYKYELLSVKDYIESNGYKFKLFAFTPDSGSFFQKNDRSEFDVIFNIPSCKNFALLFE